MYNLVLELTVNCCCTGILTCGRLWYQCTPPSTFSPLPSSFITCRSVTSQLLLRPEEKTISLNQRLLCFSLHFYCQPDIFIYIIHLIGPESSPLSWYDFYIKVCNRQNAFVLFVVMFSDSECRRWCCWTAVYPCRGSSCPNQTSPAQ